MGTHHHADHGFHSALHCSCGKRDCPVMEVARQMAEAKDHVLLLLAEQEALQQSVLPSLQGIVADREGCLDQWAAASRAHRSTAMRPTARWSSESNDEEATFRQRHHAWREEQQQAIEQRAIHCKVAVQAHENHLLVCQQYLIQEMQPGCIPAIQAVLQERLALVEAQVKRTEASLLQRQGDYQVLHDQNVSRLQHFTQQRLAIQQECLLGLQEEGAKWLMYGLLAVGKPSSLSQSQTAWNQLQEKHLFAVLSTEQKSFLGYSAHYWALEKQRLLDEAKHAVLLHACLIWKTVLKHLVGPSQTYSQMITLLLQTS